MRELDGLRRRRPPGPRGLVAHQAQLGLQLVPAQGVHITPQPVRHRRPHPGVRPSARLLARQVEPGRGVRGIRGRAAVGAGMGAHEGAVDVEHADARGAERDEHLLPGEGGARRVEVRAVDLRLALLVGDRPEVADGLEGLGGQAQHGEPVLDEQLLLGLPLDPAGLARRLHAPRQQVPVEHLGVGQLGRGDQQVAPDEAHLVLHRPLLVAGVRVAERVGEAVVGREPAEQLGGAHAAAYPAAHAGGVVEDDPGGHAADVLEYLLERLAHALGVLAGEHLGEADVGVWEGQHEEA